MAKGSTKSKAVLPVMSHNEAANLKAKIDEDKAYLADVTGKAEGNAEYHLPAAQVVDMDLGSIEARVKRNEAALDRFSPESRRLSGAERQKAEKEREGLSEWLAPRMLTEAEIGAYPSAKDAVKDAAYNRALKKALASDSEFSPAFQTKAQRWKYLSRVLYPEDPEACSMNLLRLKGEKSGRHF